MLFNPRLTERDLIQARLQPVPDGCVSLPSYMMTRSGDSRQNEFQQATRDDSVDGSSSSKSEVNPDIRKDSMDPVEATGSCGGGLNVSGVDNRDAAESIEAVSEEGDGDDGKTEGEEGSAGGELKGKKKNRPKKKPSQPHTWRFI